MRESQLNSSSDFTSGPQFQFEDLTPLLFELIVK
jgi:hypothetical protein